jgi:hypothetical protein
MIMRPTRPIIVGTSLAVILPRQLCRLRQIDRTTEMTIELEGEYIVLKPKVIKKPSEPGRVLAYARLANLMRTLEGLGLTRERFLRLSHDGTRLQTFLTDISIRGLLDPITVERLEKCLERRRTVDESWDATIKVLRDELPSLHPEQDVPLTSPTLPDAPDESPWQPPWAKRRTS